MQKGIIIFLTIIFLTACTTEPVPEENLEERELAVEVASFQTVDRVTIMGTYWPGGPTAVLLLHMMPATKESWEPFAELLAKEGFTVFAIDLRGHGESTLKDGESIDYREFSDEDHQASIHDVETAVKYLQEKGATTVYIIGASIGANLALWYQAEHPEVKKTVLLSAGTNYRGIETIPLAAKVQDDQQIYFVAGTFDGSGESSSENMAKQIMGNVTGEAELKVFASTAHGTDLFTEYPELLHDLVAWLKG